MQSYLVINDIFLTFQGRTGLPGFRGNTGTLVSQLLLLEMNV